MQRVLRGLFSWDFIGAGLAVGCLFHCIALPFVISFAPALGLEIFLNEAVHKVLASFVVVSSIAAFYPGFRSHGRKLILICAVLGLGAILLGAFFAHDFLGEQWELPLNVIGGLLLVTAHYLNHTFCKTCKLCEEGIGAHS